MTRRGIVEAVDVAADLLHGMALHPRSAISSRWGSDSYRREMGFAEDPNVAKSMPPTFRNRLVPTGCDTPAATTASSLPSQLRSLARAGTVHRVPPQVDSPMEITALVQTDSTAVFEWSQQTPTSGWCETV
jgi:hypothetical protein